MIKFSFQKNPLAKVENFLEEDKIKGNEGSQEYFSEMQAKDDNGPRQDTSSVVGKKKGWRGCY